MKKIVIKPLMSSISTEIYIGKSLLTSAFLKQFFSKFKGKIVVAADHAVKDLYAVDLAKQIGAELLTVPSGERAKSQEVATSLMDDLFKIGAGRDTLLVALGGGVTTDLVGFVASIYMRGLPLILIPTTLLGVVDASIGGKTAIDTPSGKNLIGTVYHPQAVFADLDTLQTLPEKEWFNGLAEILKMGLIYDASIWEMVKKNPRNSDLIVKAMEGKVAIIEQDPTELGYRRMLNFGHTIGHALENVANYEMSHGEAVALGCLAESHLSMHLGLLSSEDFEQIEAAYSGFPLRLPKAYTRTSLFQAMAHDKKKASGEVRFVLIDRIGHVIPFDGAYCRAVSSSELTSTLEWIEGRYS